MITPKRIDVNQDLHELLVRRGKNRDAVTEMLSWNMVTPNWFSYLTGLSIGRVSQLNNPVDPKIDVIFPFRNFDKRYKDRSGPSFVLMNEKAISYIQKIHYERKSKISK